MKEGLVENNNSVEEKLSKILPFVRMPGRYLGGETASVLKEKAKTRVVLCFPDLYEIGMSNLGLSILYASLNKEEEIACERVYAVESDMEEAMKKHSLLLYTLESKRDVRDADILGFTLQYELLYTNILSVLNLSGINIFRKNRGEDVPLVIAGGPCAYNPRVLDDFIDLFLIGEMDNEIVSFVNEYQRLKDLSLRREEIIEKLASLSYVYAPAIHTEKHSAKKYIEKDFENSVCPTNPVIPLVKTVQERGVIEISRGCTHNCRFCAAGITYRPLRYRSAKRIVSLIKDSLENAGMREINLSSLSADDYPNIKEFIEYLQEWGKRSGFSITLPSMRIDSFDTEVAKTLSTFKKSGLTFAIEAGTPELRASINKSVSEEGLLNIVSKVRTYGYKTVKVYFMLGFTEDIEKEGEEIKESLMKLSKVAGRRMRINASINVFVPKAHTPLQYIQQADYKKVTIILSNIREGFKRTNVYLKQNPPVMSMLEAIASRGGSEAGKIIYLAYEKGARFDAWEDKLNKEAWEEAIEESMVDVKKILAKRDIEENLPWDVVDCGVSKKFLESEYQKFIDGEYSPDCRISDCLGCGHNKAECFSGEENSLEDLPPLPNEEDIRGEAVSKIFVRYARESNARFLGHFDIKRLILKALSLSKLRVAYSNGFSPKPKVVFTNPLPFGVSSDSEYFEVSLSQVPNNLLSLSSLLQKNLPQGLRIISIRLFPVSEKPIKGSFPYFVRLKTEGNSFEALSNNEEFMSAFTLKEEDGYLIVRDRYSHEPPIKRILSLVEESSVVVSNCVKCLDEFSRI